MANGKWQRGDRLKAGLHAVCYESYDSSTNLTFESKCKLRKGFPSLMQIASRRKGDCYRNGHAEFGARGGFDLMRVDTTSYELFGQIFSGIKCAQLMAGASLPMVYDWKKVLRLPTASRGGPTKSDQFRPESLESGEPQNSSEPNWLVERLTFETI
jgi:hypothetical protein